MYLNPLSIVFLQNNLFTCRRLRYSGAKNKGNFDQFGGVGGYVGEAKLMDKYLQITTKENCDEASSSSKRKAESCDETKDCAKKKREASIVWNFFKKTQDKQHANCKICGKVYKTAGNTSNLLDHLKRIHPEALNGKESTPMASCMRTFLEQGITYESGPRRKNEIDNHLLRMVALDLQPFSIVNDRGFIGFANALDPRYKIPSRRYVRDVLVHNKYKELQSRLMEILKSVEHVSITTDCWTSKANEGYLTVTCHFVTEDFELKSVVLSTAKLLTPTNHTAENIANSLGAILIEWDVLKKVVSVVTDNDATMKKACEILQLKHLPCFAHTINLLVQDVLKLPALLPILSKCKRIVTIFKHSTIAYEKFKKAQGCDNPYSLIQEVSTRWNSALKMMERILLTSEFIGPVLLNSAKSPDPLTMEEVQVLKEITKILKPFEEATTLSSYDKKVSVSLILPIICELNHNMDSILKDLKTPEAMDAVTFLRKRLTERFSHYELRTIPRIATLLDPRYKKYGFLSPGNADQAAIALELEAYNILSKAPKPTPPPEPPDEQIGFNFLKEKIKQKVTSCRADAVIELRQHLEAHNEKDDCDPLKYWQQNVQGFALRNTCKKFFCVPASSCESERMFSKAGLLISDRRCALKPKLVNELLFLNKNIQILD